MLEWCHLCHQKKLSGVNVTVLEGFTQLHFYRYYVQFKNLRKRYNIRHSFSPSPGSISSEILKAELASSKSASPLQDENSCVPKKDLECQESADLSAHPIICKYGTKTQGLTSYLLSAEEMARNAYPLKGSPTCQSFLPTQTDEQVADSSPLYGLDCEMCETACGAELTRVSLVDSEGCCVLDELVKPENPILNYVTRYEASNEYSKRPYKQGITKAMLMPVKTRLKDVQVQVIKALPRDAVLVGHSLENDLHALKLIHPHVIDTSLLYQKECGRKFKLKFLAKAVLNRQIQNGKMNGHNPTEDAVAALELAQFADAMKAAGLSGVHICKAAGNDKDLFTEMWNTIICSSDQEMLVQLRDMCTVYAGPLPKCYREKSVRRLFQHCGPIQHIRILDGMWRAHAEVVFEMLEGAHLAVDTLNGYELDGYPIKVQKPVKESTLDLEVALKKLESDVLNSNVIYIMGIPKTTLCPDFTQFGPAEGVILPKKTSPGKRRKDAFISESETPFA
ncbi:hypothetical protein Z043_120386 [Scleropages formosus]|uniref:RRM domain-containing protein n=1 Tax=Scleropages formosus TaxID=113540 RepID=A0A0N8JWP4_SCLFO|nr:hypothetical protein Z043_120386 [Scleropages formosus]